jgi:hypothetical protein
MDYQGKEVNDMTNLTSLALDTEVAVLLPEREALSYWPYGGGDYALIDAHNSALAVNMGNGWSASARAVAVQNINVTQ